jgi:hypothetical protein
MGRILKIRVPICFDPPHPRSILRFGCRLALRVVSWG